jgi:hypothetical protein
MHQEIKPNDQAIRNEMVKAKENTRNTFVLGFVGFCIGGPIGAVIGAAIGNKIK